MAAPRTGGFLGGLTSSPGILRSEVRPGLGGPGVCLRQRFLAPPASVLGFRLLRKVFRFEVEPPDLEAWLRTGERVGSLTVDPRALRAPLGPAPEAVGAALGDSF